MRVFIPSIFIKMVMFLIPLILLKILSVKLSNKDFSDFFILYNISLYLYAFLFALPAISTLRFYHHIFFKKLSRFAIDIFLISTICIVLISFLFWIIGLDGYLDILSVLVLSSGIGYFTFVANIYRSNEFLFSLLLFNILILILILSFLYFGKNQYDIRYLILNLGAIYWIVSLLSRFFIIKSHNFNQIFRLPSFKNIFENQLLLYSLPLAIVALTNSLLGTSNQIILRLFVSERELAGYIAGYVISEKILFSVQSLIVFIFLPIIYKKFDDISSRAVSYIKKVSFFYLLFGLLIFPILLVYRDSIILTLSSEDLITFSWIVPSLAIGLIFLGISSLMSEVFLVAKDSVTVMKIYILGFLINLILNLSLIPPLGLIGAIISTTISNLAILFLNIFFLYKLRGSKLKI